MMNVPNLLPCFAAVPSPVDVEVLEVRVVGPPARFRFFESELCGYSLWDCCDFPLYDYLLSSSRPAYLLILVALWINSFWVQSLINVTLTLPGIAAFLLSMGMAVDANIIIFERIKDELRHGKTLSAAVTSGFKRAFKAILDSNVTTLIATVVLFYFGVSSIKGFAITLSIGIFGQYVYGHRLYPFHVEDVR